MDMFYSDIALAIGLCLSFSLFMMKFIVDHIDNTYPIKK